MATPPETVAAHPADPLAETFHLHNNRDLRGPLPRLRERGTVPGDHDGHINFHLVDHFNVRPDGTEFFFTTCHD